MTTNRHGTNQHPELPPCPTCARWAWRTGGVHIGFGAIMHYVCSTDGCHGKATVIRCGLAFAAMYEAEQDANLDWRIPQDVGAWLDSARALMRSHDINRYVYGDEAPPTAMPVPSRPAGCSCLVGVVWWSSATDVAPMFAARVERLREAARGA